MAPIPPSSPSKSPDEAPDEARDEAPDETPDEKRTYVRYPIWFPVTLKVREGMREGVPEGVPEGVEEAEVWTICRDASPGGLLVASVGPLELEQRVVASFRLGPDAPDRHVNARVVRVRRAGDDLALPFPFRVAIAFDEPILDLLKP